MRIVAEPVRNWRIGMLEYSRWQFILPDQVAWEMVGFGPVVPDLQFVKCSPGKWYEGRWLVIILGGFQHTSFLSMNNDSMLYYLYIRRHVQSWFSFLISVLLYQLISLSAYIPLLDYIWSSRYIGTSRYFPFFLSIHMYTLPYASTPGAYPYTGHTGEWPTYIWQSPWSHWLSS